MGLCKHPVWVKVNAPTEVPTLFPHTVPTQGGGGTSHLPQMEGTPPSSPVKASSTTAEGVMKALWVPELPHENISTPKGAWKVDQECYLPRVNKVVRFCSQSSPTVGIHSTKGQHMQSHLREEVRSTQRECLCEISKGLWLCSRRAAWHDLTESPGNPVAQRACHHQPMSFLVWLKANFH